MVECLPSTCEALSWISKTRRKKKAGTPKGHHDIIVQKLNIHREVSACLHMAWEVSPHKTLASRSGEPLRIC